MDASTAGSYPWIKTSAIRGLLIGSLPWGEIGISANYLNRQFKAIAIGFEVDATSAAPIKQRSGRKLEPTKIGRPNQVPTSARSVVSSVVYCESYFFCRPYRGWITGGNVSSAYPRSMYALSAPITVTSNPVPEPTSLAIFGTICLVAVRRRTLKS